MRLLYAVAPLTLTSCSATVMAGGPVPETEHDRLVQLEQRYSDAQELWQQLRVTEARGATASRRGSSLDELRRAYQVSRERLLESLHAIDSLRLAAEDRRALREMRETLEADALDDTGSALSGSMVACAYEARAIPKGGADSAFEQLSARIYTCYGRAARSVLFRGDTLDRLTVLGRLGTTADREERRALFLSLRPVWESVNGDNSPSSPYRTLIPLSAAEWQREGSYIAEQARSLGIEPSRVEGTLVRILEAWRDHTPDQVLEPWDWWYQAGAASRRLSPRVTREGLREINDRFYSDLGASPTSLGIQYDLDPRAGKTPVAFTDFGAPPRRDVRGWRIAEPWIFATYRVGGLDNLNELIHETGHAIHIAGIETRPAFATWPDSDPFTEAMAEIGALEVYEPRWQRKYLGDSASLDESLRARYAGIVLDVAWALFELRMHADPARDPNALWTEITNRYLRIAPHPEFSWWAMRGQLVDSPGYMMNYALGAIVAAAVRDVIVRERGPLWRGDRKLYGWLSDRLYKWGLERPSREVLTDFLGRPLSEDALLRDMSRMNGGDERGAEEYVERGARSGVVVAQPVSVAY